MASTLPPVSFVMNTLQGNSCSAREQLMSRLAKSMGQLFFSLRLTGKGLLN